MECRNGLCRSETVHVQRKLWSLVETLSDLRGFDDLSMVSSCSCLRLGQTLNPAHQTQNPSLNFSCGEALQAGDDLIMISSCSCLRLGQALNPTHQTQNPRLNFGCGEASQAGSVNPRPFILNPGIGNSREGLQEPSETHGESTFFGDPPKKYQRNSQPATLNPLPSTPNPES